MTSREKFEAWWEQEKYDDKLNYITGIMFNRIKVNMFLSWKAASREQEQKLTDMAVQLANAESKSRELAAENDGLKNGVTYFACGSEYGFDLFSDKQAAIDTAQEEIELHREFYLDGSGSWDKGVERAAWGIVIQSAQRVSTDGYQVSDSQLAEQACDYRLEYEVKTPTTDSFLDEVRAQGVEMFAERKNNEMMSLHPDTHAVGSIAAAMSAEVKELREFAAQLRKGGAA